MKLYTKVKYAPLSKVEQLQTPGSFIKGDQFKSSDIINSTVDLNKEYCVAVEQMSARGL